MLRNVGGSGGRSVPAAAGPIPLPTIPVNRSVSSSVASQHYEAYSSTWLQYKRLNVLLYPEGLSVDRFSTASEELLLPAEVALHQVHGLAPSSNAYFM